MINGFNNMVLLFDDITNKPKRIKFTSHIGMYLDGCLPLRDLITFHISYQRAQFISLWLPFIGILTISNPKAEELYYKQKRNMKIKQGKLYKIAVWFYEFSCPLRLKWKIERKNWIPKNISFENWYESSGYEFDFERPSLAKWLT